jgi:hypothetical protein
MRILAHNRERIRFGAVNNLMATSGLAILLLGAGCDGGPTDAANGQPTGYAEASELASLVCPALEHVGADDRKPSDAEIMAALRRKLDLADRIGGRKTECAPVARDFGEALRKLVAQLKSGPDLSHALEHGVETFQSFNEGDDRQAVLGALAWFQDYTTARQYIDQLSQFHTAIVTCRLRAAEIAKGRLPTGTAAINFSGSFLERPDRENESLPPDTLTLRNDSGLTLHHVIAVVELTGKDQEGYVNAYYTPDWVTGTAVNARCQSQEPVRETVAQVHRVRCWLFSDEGCSPTLQIGQ